MDGQTRTDPSEALQGRHLASVDEILGAGVLDGKFGRSAAYKAFSTGAIPGGRRVGRRLLIAVPEFLAWLGLDDH